MLLFLCVSFVFCTEITQSSFIWSPPYTLCYCVTSFGFTPFGSCSCPVFRFILGPTVQTASLPSLLLLFLFWFVILISFLLCSAAVFVVFSLSRPGNRILLNECMFAWVCNVCVFGCCRLLRLLQYCVIFTTVMRHCSSPDLPHYIKLLTAFPTPTGGLIHCISMHHKTNKKVLLL